MNKHHKGYNHATVLPRTEGCVDLPSGYPPPPRTLLQTATPSLTCSAPHTVSPTTAHVSLVCTPLFFVCLSLPLTHRLRQAQRREKALPICPLVAFPYLPPPPHHPSQFPPTLASTLFLSLTHTHIFLSLTISLSLSPTRHQCPYALTAKDTTTQQRGKKTTTTQTKKTQTHNQTKKEENLKPKFGLPVSRTIGADESCDSPLPLFLFYMMLSAVPAGFCCCVLVLLACLLCARICTLSRLFPLVHRRCHQTTR